ncbi:response regulator [Burkholderia glumae]|uniref:response regulator n=1 Tax=Burkholderia glumae TaxID=337 RepID=UPI000C276E48|nr:response regulator [Burkholderia glumae]MCM2551679.1 response regulator [Burkholderia glumae]NVE25370.1 response regulator [Burkholderia glumae]PJO20986.1 response regulator [Burkholderia glumae AU6208]QGA39444.1 response regulator [Burkholderia glumae]QHE13668.1 response regulator [Burkholderia glumae AU6208]
MKTILIVDDEFDVLTVWRLLLEQCGYAVFTASNGALALDRIREGKPDLIVTDFMMPVMSGGELCAALANEPDWRAIPIILCSAAADIPPQPNASILYARKPLSFDALLGMVRRQLGETAG